MYQMHYADIQEDAIVDARARERQLFERSISLLSVARESGQESLQTVEAVHFTHRLWSALLQDLSRDDNQLPSELRASLISIGIWILKEVERIRQGESDDYEGIIEITESIKRGIS